jgi:hypothetical protein
VMLPRADERWMTKGPCTTSVLQRGGLSLISQRPSSSAAAAPPVPPAPDGASVKVDATRCACKRLGEILQPSTTYTATNMHAACLRTLPKCTRGIPDVYYENVNGTTSHSNMERGDRGSPLYRPFRGPEPRKSLQRTLRSTALHTLGLHIFSM